ncbi:hypothetical protein LENED_005986 [Lentinula edodes]|uniref:Uncharacterized protein n=1 Tax=Lentinula edodes TaxID=5353 RepID=A0A1Q3EAF9_LENED|nr:hypothetical protein LENED_005986 [Lentinula edodes]
MYGSSCVAFGLSMLCLNCQQGIGSSGNGINAGLGEYQLYLQGSRPVGQRCFPNVNQSYVSQLEQTHFMKTIFSLPTTTDHAALVADWGLQGNLEGFHTLKKQQLKFQHPLHINLGKQCWGESRSLVGCSHNKPWAIT